MNVEVAATAAVATNVLVAIAGAVSVLVAIA